MNYAMRWTLAVALKQADPNLSETGAEDPTSATPPPTFTVEQMEPAIQQEKWKMGAWGAAGGLVVGALLGIFVRPGRSRARA